LFNSLNVLSSLIHRDLDQSETFITEFSRIYRYVLETHQQSLVPLDRELSFVQSYLFLQKIRFGEALVIEMKDDFEQTENPKLLPPLSLQLVLENAIKHNVSSPEHPLAISIEVRSDQVRVKNAYQPRPNGAASTGMGQDNLRQRYRLLEAPEPTFYRQEQSYWAILPLVDQVHESIDH
ncbi:MAG: histidine kinase, partial [Bacteroidota bacterium]